jgi:hypothetical protein
MRWIDSAQRPHSVQGHTVDVPLCGAGVVVPVQIQPDRELKIILNGVEVLGGAAISYLHPYESGFKAGLYFRLKLLRQSIPGVDEILLPPLSRNPTATVLGLANRFRGNAEECRQL